MLIETSAALAAVTAVWLGVHDYKQRQLAKRRDRILVQGLQQVSTDWMEYRSRLESTRIMEMETYLLEVRSTGEYLSGALAAQSRWWQMRGTTKNQAFILKQWKASQSIAGQAQKAYDEAIEQYQEFVQSLPAALRSKAVERGNTVALAVN